MSKINFVEEILKKFIWSKILFRYLESIYVSISLQNESQNL